MRLKTICFKIAILFCEQFAFIWGDLPPAIHKCKSTNNDKCIARAVEDVLRRYSTGNPQFGLPNISALNATNVIISKSKPNSPIQINLEFIKCTIYGLEKGKILRASGVDKNLNKVEIDALVTLKLKGDYEMTGKMLLLPINGKGKAEIEVKEAKTMLHISMDKEQRNNKTYFKNKKLKAHSDPKQITVKFENLFNGNPVLSQTLNDVINENWKDVWAELQDGINHAVASLIGDVTTKIFDVLPLEDMYADD